MTVSVNWSTKVITVQQADLTLVSGSLYELDVDQFRLTLRSLEDDAEGLPFPTTHNHSSDLTIGGVTYAPVVEIINGYTITFEDGQYRVSLIGANNNIADVTNLNQVSVQSNNSGGLVNGNIGDQIVEGDVTVQQALRLLLSAAVGREVVVGQTVTYRDLANTMDRIRADVSGGVRDTTYLDGA